MPNQQVQQAVKALVYTMHEENYTRPDQVEATIGEIKQELSMLQEAEQRGMGPRDRSDFGGDFGGLI